jgi:hypothetical protein
MYDQGVFPLTKGMRAPCNGSYHQLLTWTVPGGPVSLTCATRACSGYYSTDKQQLSCLRC